jgi:CDP-6-deoxy-D-xylo-4-hexulose-3-dehydrase
MENDHAQDIKEFIRTMSQKYGHLPKFAHNQVAKDPKKVYYSGPYFDQSELAAAIETFLFGKWSSSGEVCARFEKEFCKYIKHEYAFFCNSGSSANLLLIAACKEYFGWQDGDEIVVSAVGFPTTVSAIVQNGLNPVFVDIEWNTLNFDLHKILNKFTGRTRAVFLSPVLGNPPDMDYLIDLLAQIKVGNNKTEVKLLLDNCDSLGTKWKNKFLNEYAVASSYSFYPAHEITTLEGGMVSSNVMEIVDLARSYATWGRDCYCVGAANLLCNGTCGKRFSNWIPEFPDLVMDHKYVFNRIGWNLKPLDLQAAIGLEQLKKLDYICERRDLNKKLIQATFQLYVNGLKFPNVLQHTSWVPFGVPIICETKEQKRKLVDFLEKNGVQTRNYFAGNLLMHKGYKHLGNYLDYPESNKVLDLVFFVGCAPTISPDNITHINNVLATWKN